MRADLPRRIPYPPLLWRSFRSGVFMWVVLRVAYVIVLLAGAELIGLFNGADALEFAKRPAPATRVLLMILAAALVHIDRVRAHENVLSANLGVSSRWFIATSLLAAAIVDSMLQLLLHMA
jgi:hypothetical protein